MRKASTPCVIMTGPPTNVRRKASLRLRMRSALDSVLLVMARSLYVWGKGWRSLVAGARGNKRDGPKAAPKRPWGLKPLPGLLARDAEFGMGDGNIFGPTLECRIFGRLKKTHRGGLRAAPLVSARSRNKRSPSLPPNIE